MVSKPRAILLHGLGESASDYESSFKKYAAAKLKGKIESISFLSLPFHAPAHTPSHSLCSHKGNHKESFFSSFPPTEIIIAYSMGGRLALEYAARERSIQKLILFSTHFGLPLSEREERLAEDQRIFSKVSRMGRRELKAFFFEWYGAAIWGNLKSHPKFSELINKKVKKLIGSRWSEAAIHFSLGKQDLSAETLKKLGPKIQFFSGELDSKYTALGKKYQVEYGVNHTVLPLLGHGIHAESPQTFWKEILTFLFL